MISPIEAMRNVYITDAVRWDPRMWVYYTYVRQCKLIPWLVFSVSFTVLTYGFPIAVYMFADLAYVLFPVLIVWWLNMNLRRRIGLILLLSSSLKHRPRAVA